MAMQDYLDQEIKKICPIDGISFPNLEDKTGWRVDFKDEATPEQRQAAIEYIENFVWTEADEQREKKLADLEAKKLDPGYRAGYFNYKKDNPNATFEDYCDYLDKIQID